MADNNTPELTLDPTAVAVEMPTLTLNPEAPEVPQVEEKKIEPVEMDEKLLTEEERKPERNSPTRSTSGTAT